LTQHDRRQASTTRRQRGGTTAAVLVTVLGLGAAAAGYWWQNKTPEGTAVDMDRVVVVEAREVLDAVNSSGRVEPLVRVAVMSRASGIVEQLLVEEGDAVTTGQVLAELDREQLEAELAQDRADLQSAQARVAAATARVEEAKVALEDPELEFVQHEAERLALLFDTGDVTERELEGAQREHVRVKFAIERLTAGLPVLEAAIAEARANLDSAAAAVERSETALSEATILSPIDGIVLVRNKEVGDGVSSILTAGGNATQLMTLGDLSEMYIEARVDEVDLGRIHVGMPARVTVDAHRGHTLTGQVERIAPAGSVDNNGIVTFEVRVTVEDPEALLKPDMTADARLIIDQRAEVASIAHSALKRTADDGWSAKRVVGSGLTQRVEDVEVEIGLSDGLITEIVSGLAIGDRVLLPDTLAGGRR
jgi:HlyD family secretion protein